VNFDFAAILVGLTALTGIIWGLDHLFFARARAERAALPGAEARSRSRSSMLAHSSR
jgi:hypothetical protein